LSSEKITPSEGKEGASLNPLGRATTGSSLAAVCAVCDGHSLLRSLRAGGAWLERHVAQVNALNVFPVPDGDTGTNMSLTMRAALAEVGDRSCSSVSELARVVAHGALMGARGNSGVILSQILRGVARALDGKDTLNGEDLAMALREGATTAYKGVMKPVEGTILTVAREAAEEAGRALAEGANMPEMLARVLDEAQSSLARTPQLLPVLAAAGVVDAGGQGFTFILEGVLRQLCGETVEGASVATAGTEAELTLMPEGEYNYDTQFVIQGEGLNVETIRQGICAMGDSVLVVGDSSTVKVHVHSDNPGAVISYGASLGQLAAVIVENMQLQYQDFKERQQRPTMGGSNDAPTSVAPAASEQLSNIGIVAVASGEGLQRVFESLGVSAIVPGGQTMNPSTQDLLKAVESIPCDQVVLLPNNGNIILTAQQTKDLTAKRVWVVPTKTIPQGIAALLAFNYQADLETNAEFMTRASKQVQTAEITRAVRSVHINGLAVSEGQIIGLLNDDLQTAGEDITTVILDLLRRMIAEGHEIITIYYGEDVPAEEADVLAGVLRESYPGLEVEVLDGGQPHYYYIISAE